MASYASFLTLPFLQVIEIRPICKIYSTENPKVKPISHYSLTISATYSKFIFALHSIIVFLILILAHLLPYYINK